VILASIAWAMLLLQLGLGSMVFGSGLAPIPVAATWFLGLSGVAGGQFVFMVLVADRIVPRAPRGLVGAAEAAAFMVFLAGLVLMALFVGLL
jgi:hypothetical protein